MKEFHYMAKINSYIFFFFSAETSAIGKNLCDHAEKMTLWVILCAGFIPRGGENCGVIAEGETGGRLSAVFSAFKPRICIAFNLSDVISQKMPELIEELSGWPRITGL